MTTTIITHTTSTINTTGTTTTTAATTASSNDTSLDIFASSNDTSLKGSFKLRAGCLISPAEQQGTHGFSLTCGESSLVLGADSEQQRAEWMRLIAKGIAGAGNKKSQSVLQGHLKLREDKGANYTMFLFRLNPDGWLERCEPKTLICLITLITRIEP
jgi:hypothetical protein